MSTIAGWNQKFFRNLSAIYAPDLVVLGGGVALGGGQRLLDEASKVIDQNLKIVPRPKLVFTKLNYESALWGAYTLALILLHCTNRFRYLPLA